jgi:prepilin-type N-terminal cleavage/methylation domain-containing protein
MKTSNKGFTLIELLIVIAVLGILAVAVLAAINPIEQINRSRDTGSRSDAEQLIGAIDRFYASRGFYPWQTAPGTAAAGVTWTQVTTAWTGVSTVPILTQLSQAGTEEIKQSFVTRITSSGYNPLHIYNRGQQGDSYYVCFLPQSGAFRREANDRCSTGLPSDLQPISTIICGNTTNPYSCLP